MTRCFILADKPPKVWTQAEQQKAKKNQRLSANAQQGNMILTWAENYVIAVPTYFDRNGIFWQWDFDNHRYRMVDDTDILNGFRSTGNTGEVSVTKKNIMLEAIRQVAREYEPIELSKEWIQFGDTLYNFQTGEEKRASYKYFATNPIPWSPAKSDETPEFDKLFEEWVGEKHVKTLYQIIAYCTICDYPLHRFFVLTGSGLNGKGKFLEILERFIGDSNATSIDLDAITDSSNRFEKSNLYKKLVALVGETNYGRITKTGMLKSLTGGDLMTFEFKNKNPFQARNYAKIIMATNSLPPTTDRTTGFYRRPLIIDFPNTFEENPHLLDRIPDSEYNALARKCLGVLDELMTQKKFHKEGSINERMQKYEDVSNPLQRFIREKCVKDPSKHIFKFEFRDRFLAWQTQNGYRSWNEKMLGQSMKEVFEEQRLSHESGNRWFAWVGLGWKTESDGKLLDKRFDASGGLHKNPHDHLIQLVRSCDNLADVEQIREQAKQFEGFDFDSWLEECLKTGVLFEPKKGFVGVLE